MSYLVDTNIMLKFFNIADLRNKEVVHALDALTDSGEDVYVCLQVLREYWAVATRPTSRNGLGLISADADHNLVEFQKLCPCLQEPSDIMDRWRDQVQEFGIAGKQTYDARLAALMVSHGVTHILTFNPADYALYKLITPVTPQEVI